MDKKEESTIKRTKKRKTPESESVKLFRTAVKHLELRQNNEYIPYFLLNPDDKINNVFAQMFVAKHCRNAYAGLFIKFDHKPSSNLNEKEKKWVTSFRQKGYGCVVIDRINKFDRCIEAYKHTVGVSGYNYFHATYERSHL